MREQNGEEEEEEADSDDSLLDTAKEQVLEWQRLDFMFGGDGSFFASCMGIPFSERGGKVGQSVNMASMAQAWNLPLQKLTTDNSNVEVGDFRSEEEEAAAREAALKAAEKEQNKLKEHKRHIVPLKGLKAREISARVWDTKQYKNSLADGPLEKSHAPMRRHLSDHAVRVGSRWNWKSPYTGKDEVRLGALIVPPRSSRGVHKPMPPSHTMYNFTM